MKNVKQSTIALYAEALLEKFIRKQKKGTWNKYQDYQEWDSKKV